MNRLISIAFIFLLINCGGKNKDPNPDNTLQGDKTKIPDATLADSSLLQTSNQFYELEESIDQIHKQIARLQTQVAEYEQGPSETNYTKKLKELIESPPPSHKISLINGSVINGTIEKDRIEDVIVLTELGKLTINKKEIESIQDLILPIPQITFIGHGKEEVIEGYYHFTGKVINQGSRRGDFVRIIYQLWGEDTQLISSDSSFISGSHIMYKSGVITDSVLEPNQSARFSVKVDHNGEIPVSYVTRKVHWSLYD